MIDPTPRSATHGPRTEAAPAAGTHPRNCPICGYRGPFGPHGLGNRPNARCGRCRSLERHRLLHLYLTQDGGNRLEGQRILHLSPEHLVAPLTGAARLYVASDLTLPDMAVRADATALPFADDSFDVILCSHVLEHIPDDAGVLAEFHRVLCPGGSAVLMIPIIEGWDATYEDWAITDPEERALHFGRWDHVRFYGRDFVDRIAAAGFETSYFQPAPADCVRYAIGRGDKVFLGLKA